MDEESRAADLTCPNCSKKYVLGEGAVPLLTRCLHALCGSCIDAGINADKKTFVCPTCQNEETFPDGPTKSNFLTNGSVRNQLFVANAAMEKRMCAVCSDDEAAEATHHCIDCPDEGELLCDTHLFEHGRLKISKSHKPIALASLVGGAVPARWAQSFVKCNTHTDRSAEYICDTCSTLVCEGCTIAHQKDYKDHECVLYQEHCAKLRQTVLGAKENSERYLSAVLDAIAELTSNLANVGETETELVEKAKEIEKQLLSRVEDVMKRHRGRQGGVGEE